MTTETKVEAVAWAVAVNGKPDFADIRKWECEREAAILGDIPETISIEPLYPQSALDALRGEVAEQSAWADKWKALHDAVSLAHEVQTKSIVRAFARADAAERRAAELEAVLRPLADATFAEFCSKKTERIEPDDSKVSYPEDRCHITFGMIRNARKALTKESP